jgi:two-component system nitrogen regulation response regulator NtrX
VLRDGEVWVERAAEDPSLRRVDLRPIGIDERDDEQRIVPELRKRFLRCAIATPPLRRRREDIPALVKFLVTDLCLSLKVPRKIPSNQATQLLAALPWRGNLAELKELLRTLVVNVPGPVIRISDVLAYTSLDTSSVTFLAGGPLKEACERFEREYVAHVLERHHGRVADAAKALGIQRTNLYRKLRQLSVQRRDTGRAD